MIGNAQLKSLLTNTDFTGLTDRRESDSYVRRRHRILSEHRRSRKNLTGREKKTKSADNSRVHTVYEALKFVQYSVPRDLN